MTSPVKASAPDKPENDAKMTENASRNTASDMCCDKAHWAHVRLPHTTNRVGVATLVVMKQVG